MNNLLSLIKVNRRFYSPLPRNFRASRRFQEKSNSNGGNIFNNDGNNYIYDGIPSLLQHPVLVLERQIEIMNVAFGFEQRNNYAIMSPDGYKLGSMVERDSGILSTVMRQVYKLHRPFHVDVFDHEDRLVLSIKRNFSLINSHIKVILPINGQVDLNNGEILGESVQRWHLWRRRYELFTNEGDNTFVQFGDIDSPFLAFSFPIRNEEGFVTSSIDRNWVGLAREMFTDSGIYVVRMGNMDDINNYGNTELINWRQRAVLLANAVSIDFDYFSRHSGSSNVGYYE